jgi:hypothetical protein
MEWKNEFGEIEKLLTRSSFEKVEKNAKDTRSTQSKKTPASGRQVRLLLLCSNAKKNIRDVAFRIKKPKQRAVYIRRHQHALVRMMDYVYESPDFKRMPQRHEDTKKSPTPNIVYALLEDLHEFLRKEYADCFNARTFVPKGYLMKVREAFKIDFNDLLTVLVREKVPAHLLHVIVHPYRSIIQGKDVKWSYEKVEWLRRFIKVPGVLRAETSGGREEKVTKNTNETQRTRRRSAESPGLKATPFTKGGLYTPLVRMLIYHDFNSSGFKSWLIEAIYDDVNKKDGIFQRMERC